MEAQYTVHEQLAKELRAGTEGDVASIEYGDQETPVN